MTTRKIAASSTSPHDVDLAELKTYCPPEFKKTWGKRPRRLSGSICAKTLSGRVASPWQTKADESVGAAKLAITLKRRSFQGL